MPRAQTAVVASTTTPAQLPPRDQQPTANRPPADDHDSESGALPSLAFGVLFAS